VLLLLLRLLLLLLLLLLQWCIQGQVCMAEGLRGHLEEERS
jgi:hypothetical protein